jgi:hypothetical protein
VDPHDHVACAQPFGEQSGRKAGCRCERRRQDSNLTCVDMSDGRIRKMPVSDHSGRGAGVLCAPASGHREPRRRRSPPLSTWRGRPGCVRACRSWLEQSRTHELCIDTKSIWSGGDEPELIAGWKLEILDRRLVERRTHQQHSALNPIRAADPAFEHGRCRSELSPDLASQRLNRNDGAQRGFREKTLDRRTRCGSFRLRATTKPRLKRGYSCGLECPNWDNTCPPSAPATRFEV